MRKSILGLFAIGFIAQNTNAYTLGNELTGDTKLA